MYATIRNGDAFPSATEEKEINGYPRGIFSEAILRPIVMIATPLAIHLQRTSHSR
jgi:hypothetical protein